MRFHLLSLERGYAFLSHVEPLGDIVAVQPDPEGARGGAAEDKFRGLEEVVVVREAVHCVPKDVLAVITGTDK